MKVRTLDPSSSENIAKKLAERGDPPPGPHPSKLIDELIKNHLGPMMKDKGFRKSGANFWRDDANVIDVLNIQKSQWNDAWEASFYVNLGLTVSHFIATKPGNSSQSFPVSTTAQCLVAFLNLRQILGRFNQTRICVRWERF